MIKKMREYVELVIKTYLDTPAAKEDTFLQESLTKEGKSTESCVNYVFNALVKARINCGLDSDLYKYIHDYYVEDVTEVADNWSKHVRVPASSAPTPKAKTKEKPATTEAEEETEDEEQEEAISSEDAVLIAQSDAIANEKAELESKKAEFEKEKAKFEKEKAKLEKEKAKLEASKTPEPKKKKKQQQEGENDSFAGGLFDFM